MTQFRSRRCRQSKSHVSHIPKRKDVLCHIGAAGRRFHISQREEYRRDLGGGRKRFFARILDFKKAEQWRQERWIEFSQVVDF